MSVMREPPVKKILYWCTDCNVPLIAKSCACGREGKRIALLQPYDVRPALLADRALLQRLLTEQFGTAPLARILLLNKTGRVDRADLVIMHGERFGFLTFDPVGRQHHLDILTESLPFLAGSATKGIVDLERQSDAAREHGRIGGKKVRLTTPVPDGTVIVRYRNLLGTGMVRDGAVRVKEIIDVHPSQPTDPSWDVAVDRNRYHLKNLERNAIRTIRRHMHDRPAVNVSFSGGKDSTTVLRLARKAGVTSAFFLDTGIEFPETVAFVRSQGVEVVDRAGDFWQAAEKAGPPGKDSRWCCKLLKIHPLKAYLTGTGPCVTIQGNRWYESWNRADLEETSQNPATPLQLNISPIRNWRALEVFLYLWWQKSEINPLYEKGFERIGCFLCPAMLESEYEELRRLHPEFARRWDEFLVSWAEKKGLPDAFCRFGLWRWKVLPKKMQELCRNKGILLNDDNTLRESREKAEQVIVVAPGDQTGRPAGKTPAAAEYPVDKIRLDFPMLGDIIYLDNAATSLSPQPVVDAMVEFEFKYRANIGRGVHRLTQIASQRYWHAHEKVSKFIGGQDGTVVFCKNTTDAINMVARGLAWSPGDHVITTVLEHHSNLLPWWNLQNQGVSVDIIGIGADYQPDLSALEKAITGSTRLVAVTHASNAVGVITTVEEIARICRDHSVMLLVDGAQSVPHMPVDVSRLGCDFFAFSGHKMLGPTGTGVLWMRQPILDPSDLGGGIVESVNRDSYTLLEGYQKYEAGTPNIAGGIALGAAAEYLETLGMENVRAHEEQLTSRLIGGLKRIPGVHIYAPERPESRIGAVSFTVDGHHPHEVAASLDESADIMVRSGLHCCQPLMEQLGLADGTVRASIGLYNTTHEIDMLIATVEEILR